MLSLSRSSRWNEVSGFICCSSAAWATSPELCFSMWIDKDWRHSFRSPIALSQSFRLPLITAPSFLSCHRWPMCFNTSASCEALTWDRTSMFGIALIFLGIWTEGTCLSAILVLVVCV
ncbi:hypothetical protein SETIT_4G087600v2 [Setaria italica]|uniref:Uncharacterized protein n=2 Tax=Setaria TaxID=4554 RepID=A0A368QS70_SETIT